MFFKIILQNDITRGRFEIPSKFVRKYGNCLDSPLTLKIPNGKEWQMELAKVGEVVWFEKGWKVFAEQNSLKHGHLLVFTYEPNSHFNVNIFDMSAVEIDYPCEGSKSQPANEGRLPLDWHIQQFGANLAIVGSQSRETNFSPSNPWFKVVLQPSNIKRNYLAVPYSFVEKHMAGKAQTIMLKVEDKSWAVKLYVYPDSRLASLYVGFRSFLEENSL